MPRYRKKPVVIEAMQVPVPDDLQAWGVLADRLMTYPDLFELAYGNGERGVVGVLIHTPRRHDASGHR